MPGRAPLPDATGVAMTEAELSAQPADTCPNETPRAFFQHRLPYPNERAVA